MAINHWPADERPREKLLQRGAGALSDAELVALFLRTGVAGKSAVDVARDCLTRFGDLTGLFAATLSQLSEVRGLGPAKFTQLQAVLEMAKRALGEQLKQGPLLSSPKAVRDYLRLQIGAKPYEVFFALFLDAQNRLIDAQELFRGTLTQTSVYPREVVKHALAFNAAAVVFAHNHPSGVAEPSRADEMLTQTLQSALNLVDIRTLDHFIVAGNAVYSFSEHGKLG